MEGYMQIREAAENYLETIYILSKKLDKVRSIDIVNDLNYSKPTISVMMKQFRENGFINMDRGGYITLTEKGLKIAKKMYERHEVIASIFMALGVNEVTAYEDACKIEHDLSEETFQRFKEHYLNNFCADMDCKFRLRHEPPEESIINKDASENDV